VSKPIQLLLIAALLAAATTPSAAQRPDKDKGPKGKPEVRVVFRDSDRGVFRDYYRSHRDAVKPLPPGIAKNLARGKPLPPGIARTRVPDVVLVRLPWRPPGYTFFLVGDRVVLLDGNGLVADILLSIF
jgi:hypothetical protein